MSASYLFENTKACSSFFLFSVFCVFRGQSLSTLMVGSALCRGWGSPSPCLNHGTNRKQITRKKIKRSAGSRNYAAFPFAIKVGYFPLQQAVHEDDDSMPMASSIPSSDR